MTFTSLGDRLDALTHKILHQGRGISVHAEDVLAGTFGAGNFIFPGNLDITGISRHKSAPGTAPAPNRFWDGLELASPNSTPYIDFHRSTNPEEATDYNMRLINSAASILSLSDGAGTGKLDIEVARIGKGDFYGNFAAFAHNTRWAAGQYALLQADTGDTYLNAPAGGNIHLRINNIESMSVGSDRSLHGSFVGAATIAEAVGDSNLYNSGTANPNYIVQGGTVVGTFSGGNCAFNFGNAFPAGVNGIVTCEAGGNAGWICGNQNVTKTGFGVYLKNDAGGLASGLFRINYIALGF